MSKFRKGDKVIHEGVVRTIGCFAENSRPQKYLLMEILPEWVEEKYLKPYRPSDSDLTISLAKLREVLNGMADCDGFVVETPDTIINRIKQELR